MEKSSVSLSAAGSGEARVRSGAFIVAIAWGAATHTGNRRMLNEDSLCLASPAFFVADGMGGHDGGEVASALAAGAMASLRSNVGLEEGSLRRAIVDTNRVIHNRSDSSSRPMGTTLTGVAIGDASVPSVLVANVGDSRTYLYVNGEMRQVTIDHSAVQELVDAGRLTPEAARSHPSRNVITRALGVEPEVIPDVFVVPAAAGQRWLACSDGLTGEVTVAEIEEVISRGTAEEAAVMLVERTLEQPARDNVTVIVLDVLQVEAAEDLDRTDPRHRLAAPSTPVGAEQTPASDMIDDVPIIQEPRSLPPPRGGPLIAEVPAAVSSDLAARPVFEEPLSD